MKLPYKKIFSTLSIIYLLSPLSLHAQDAGKASPFDGEWAISFATPTNSYTFHGKLTIQGTKGTWDISNPNKKENCHGPEYPVSVIKSGDKVLVAMIQSSTIRPDCEDTKIILKINEDQTVSGSYGKNPSLTATRR